MFRTGIHNLDALKNSKLTDMFGKDKNISIQIYNELLETENDSYESLSEAVLNRFNTKGNAIKRTYRNRFNKFDDIAVDVILKQKWPKVKIHDMAISDGRASLYILDKLRSKIGEFEYQGSDLEISYNLYRENGSTGIVTDEQNNIIEITKPPYVWNYARKEGNFYFLNNWLKNNNYEKYRSKLDSGQLKNPDRILLADREFKKIIDSSKNYNIINYDLFNVSTTEFNVIRVMNILHFGYFKKEQLNVILSNIHRSLLPGGLFIEGSNEDADSPVEGAIYLRTASGFDLLNPVEKVSRIKDCVLNYNSSTPT